MNIYDFDGTIYNGDSSVDFFKFCLKKNKKCLLILPSFLWAVGLYLLKIKEKEFMKTKFFSFFKYFDNIENEVELFWEEHLKNIKGYYLKQKKKNDIIISASPEVLIKPVSKKYGFKLIATNVDKKTGKLIGKNCHGEEKVDKLRELSIKKCDEFYSDSYADTPLSEIAKKAYMVKGDNIIPWDEYKESKLKKLKRMFFSPDFFTFVAIGVVNAFNGIWIAYVYSLFIEQAVLAYICGFFTSLCISYLLNSLLNFKDKLGFKKFIKFSISNIPNFIIQVLSVVILLDTLEVSKLISYSISAIIAVPITFVLVKIFVYKK